MDNRSTLFLSAVMAAAALAAGARAAETADLIMEDLRAAHAARQAAEQALADAGAEKARREVLLQALAAGKAKAEQEAAAARAETARIKQETADGASIRELQALHSAAADAAARAEKALDAAAGELLPGVAEKTADESADAGARLQAARERLENAENESRVWRREIVSGYLDGKETAVHLLRAGSAAGWWLSLDGARAGTAVIEGGKLLLRPAADAGARENIARAFAAFDGKLIPEWVTLPLE